LILRILGAVAVWRGGGATGRRPATLAQVAPYLTVRADEEEDDEAYVERGRAFPDDEFELDGTWVFVDFWRRLGIPYTGDTVGPAYGVDMGPDAAWAGRLPNDNEWKL
jgi:hypothetical protein